MNSHKVGNEEFKSQDELTKRVQNILYSYKDGESLRGQDFNFISDLLNHHPEANEKKGCGVQSIYVDKALHGTTCFYVKRCDNTKDDFSFRSCFPNARK